ncbi:MAG: response regulator [Deltaproteobacteria bacterium]|nr:response regulator [Deltaproteobacteria bacterium]
MDTRSLAPQLMQTFRAELEEHVRVMNEELLALERAATGGERSARLTVLLRALHSLKGAARAVNLGLIAEVCHRLEEPLIAVRDGKRDLDADLSGLLFAGADALADGARRLGSGEDLESSLLAELSAQLADESGRQGVGSSVAPPPTGAVVSSSAAARTSASPAAAVPGRIVEAAVRVTAERLDALVADGGELLVAHHRLEGRRDELATLRDVVRRWNADRRRLRTSRDVPRLGQQGDDGAEWRRASNALASTAECLQRTEKELDRLVARLTADGNAMGAVAVRLEEDIRRVRMVPFAEACAGLFRAVRDLAKATDKDVELLVEGGETELDRSVLEGLKDPLLHLVRNAVDHGLETRAERSASGKSARGRVTVSAALRGARVEVVVTDDGRGIDLAAVRVHARAQGFVLPESERELVRLVFEPGLSTATIVTGVSGRGLGLDVVKSRLETLNGTIDVASEPGRGTRFAMSLPLTLTTVRALLVVAAGQMFAIAGTAIAGLRRARIDDLAVVQGHPMLPVEDGLIPVASLAAILGNGASPGGDTNVPILLVAAGGARAALAVDELVVEQEIVVKSLGPRLAGARAVTGGALLASGNIALVLNPAYLARRAVGSAARLVSRTFDAAPARAKRVLVVDDSITTRSLEKSILETAGYEVDVAADGELGWQMLQERGADVLVSDVEMPRMDGFALTETVRGSARFRELPVVLVTARESEADKARGLRAGADAYLVKSAFDQRALLETIAQLL